MGNDSLGYWEINFGNAEIFQPLFEQNFVVCATILSEINSMIQMRIKWAYLIALIVILI